MSVLIPHRPPLAVETRPFWELEESEMAQGLEGRQVREQLRAVREHWRTPSQAESDESDVLDELRSYRHPPFETVGTRLVRYVRVTELEPRKIDFTEYEDET